MLGCAHGIDRLADVAIIDRESGAHLDMHYWRGEYWVAGEPGRRYAIYVQNRFAERLLVVASVDGVNAVTGETAGWSQNGYVLDPEADYEITGWRKSDSVVAAFAFTAPRNSYAGLTGRPENIGVIGLALFRERRTLPPPTAWPDALGGVARAPLNRQSVSPAPVASGSDAEVARAAQAPAPALGTAHGEREASYVGHTTFERLHAHPDEIIRIRYDSRENLIAMGIIRTPRYVPSRAPDPFPEAQSYVPDPPSD
jgi:hypothetical protein